MKVRMLTHFASGDASGLTVIYYRAGEKYDLTDDKARAFIEVGVAIEDKDMERAPETKGIFASQDNYAPIYAQPASEPKKAQKKRRK